MTVCGCGRDHEAERALVDRFEHERRTGTTVAGDQLRDAGGAGIHYGGTICDGACCNVVDEAGLEAFWRQERYHVGNQRAREQALVRPPTQIERERPDPTAILDEPDPAADADVAVWCADCGRAHPPLLAMFDRLLIGRSVDLDFTLTDVDDDVLDVLAGGSVTTFALAAPSSLLDDTPPTVFVTLGNGVEVVGTVDRDSGSITFEGDDAAEAEAYLRSLRPTS